MSTILSACYLLSLLLVQTFASVAMGQITMRTGQMKPQIVFGFSVWLIGQGLISLFDGSYGACVLFLMSTFRFVVVESVSEVAR